MKLYTRSELKEFIGKRSFLVSKALVGMCTYIGGIQVFDEKINVKNIFEVPNIANLEIRESGLEISLMHNFRMCRTGIPDSKILSIYLEDRDPVYLYKSRSAMGRAMLGGLLFGAAGAIIGGFSAVESKKVLAKMPNLILTIEVGEQGKPERVILLGCTYKNKLKLIQLLSRYYPTRFHIC